MSNLSDLRKEYKPSLVLPLNQLKETIFLEEKDLPVLEQVQKALPNLKNQSVQKAVKGKASKPLKKIGVLFSGGQASGGHNVIAGLFDALQEESKEAVLVGFNQGPQGLIDGDYQLLTKEAIQEVRNQGGFDLIGSSRTKIDSDEAFSKVLKVVKKLELEGLVIIGGDDSNTNAGFLADYFLSQNCSCCVIGVPKTIDGDLQNDYVEISFGFDSASKTYSEMIGNIGKDALSAKKYTHLIKLMGRSASHIALECSLKTHPNLTLIGEEVAAKQMKLSEVTSEITDLIVQRSEAGKEYGVILIPEGLIEFIPDVKELVSELNRLLVKQEADKAIQLLTKSAFKTYQELPEKIQKQLLLDRDSHGNVQVSKISTEELLIISVKEELKKRGFKGSFNPQPHFFGYEGRACFPSNFDASYCYNLGILSYLLLREKKTGFMAAFKGLKKNPAKWEAYGVPLTTLMVEEERKGKTKIVIKKALVDLKKPAFQKLSASRAKWRIEDDYQIPGPMQFFKEASLTDSFPEII